MIRRFLLSVMVEPTTDKPDRASAPDMGDLSHPISPPDMARIYPIPVDFDNKSPASDQDWFDKAQCFDLYAVK